MKQYLIGIDGGASRSKGILTDLEGRQISSAENRGLNPLSVGWDKFRSNFSELLASLLSDKSAAEVRVICAGLAGTGSEEVRSRAKKEIEALIETGEVHVISDALAALWGAFEGQPGLLLIAGTGSICLGMDEHGNTARSGGFGRLLGDEGGGYWIAAEAIRTALRYADGRNAAAGSLVSVICEKYGLKEIHDIIPKVHGGDLPTEEIAGLAERVIALSASDSVADGIVREAGRHLADLAIATAQKLNLKDPKVALWGGLWESSRGEVRRSLIQALRERDLSCEIGTPAEPPEWGAIRYLRKIAL